MIHINIKARLVMIIITWLCLALFHQSNSQAEDLKALYGDPFSDPDIVQDMPSEWVNQSIKHDPSVGDADLVISLNQQFFHFIEPIINDYGRKHNLKIVTNKGTCGITAGMLTRKEGDIGGLCCPPAKTDRLPGIRYHTIGIHPVSILVNPGNPVSELTLEQVRKVFSGDITRWSELGWSDKPVYPIGRLHCKKRPGHWRLILDSEELFSPELRTVAAIEDMFSLVSSYDNAIGYEVMWMSQNRSAKVKPLKIDGNSPHELKHLMSGSYPF